MLKIIMGSERAHEFIDIKDFQEFPGVYFNDRKRVEWFEDEFVREIIEKADNAYVELGFSVRSIEYGTGYSVNDLSGSAKFLISAYEVRNKIFLATMGDNCTDLLERIALDYEKEGKDLIIVANYLHRFDFKYIKDIHYVNWDITCHSWDDIFKNIYDRWIEQDKDNTLIYDDDEFDFENFEPFNSLD